MLNKIYVEEHVRNALKEDISFEDITTENLTTSKDTMKCTLNTREDGVFCGRDVFKMVFNLLSDDVKITFYVNDGDVIKKGQKLAEIEGSARAILSGERTAYKGVPQYGGDSESRVLCVREREPIRLSR